MIIRVTGLVATDGDTKPRVVVAGRSEDGERVVKRILGTEPYFFVPSDEIVPQDVPELVRVEETYTEETGQEAQYESYDGTPLKKIVMQNPGDVGDFRDRFSQTYEADVSFDRRCSVDYGLSGYIDVPEKSFAHVADIDTDPEVPTGGITPRIVYADIETDPPDPGEDFEDYTKAADSKVTAFSYYDNYSDEYYLCCLDPEGKVDGGELRHHLESHWEGHELAEQFTEAQINYRGVQNESDLHNFFLDLIEEHSPDVLTGWNWTNFDHRYWINRMAQFDFDIVDERRLSDVGNVSPWKAKNGYQEDTAIECLPGFDMKYGFCSNILFSELRSESLEYVASQELDIGKVDHVSVFTEYDENRSRFMAYSLLDTQLLKAMDDKHGIIDFHFSLANTAGVQLTDV